MPARSEMWQGYGPTVSSGKSVREQIERISLKLPCQVASSIADIQAHFLNAVRRERLKKMQYKYSLLTCSVSALLCVKTLLLPSSAFKKKLHVAYQPLKELIEK